MQVRADQAAPIAMNLLQRTIALRLRDDRIVDDVDRGDLVFVEHRLKATDAAHRTDGCVVPGEFGGPVELLLGVHDHDEPGRLRGVAGHVVAGRRVEHRSRPPQTADGTGP